MVRKRSPDRAAESPRIDDLKLINGIGPAVEKRLNGVGILTFAQLATLSPADIAAAVAGLSGLSSERIIKQDWIGQADKLATEVVASETQQDVEVPVEPPSSIEYIEPQQADKLITEVIPSEVQEDIEDPATTEQVTAFITPVEPQASIEPAQTGTLSGEPEKDTVPLMELYHPASFTVEFLLDEDNNIHSTHVLHVESKREDTWTGWQKTQFIDFLNQSAGLNIPSDKPALLNAKELDHTPTVVTESEPLTPSTAQLKLTGTLRVREMKLIGVESSGPSRTLTHDEPFDVSLMLDLTELQVPGNTPLNYKASIYSKDRGGRSDLLVLEEDRDSRSSLIVGKAQGTIIPAATVTIKVEGNSLPEGNYQLAATVILGLPGMNPVVRPGTTAVIDGGQVQVL